MFIYGQVAHTGRRSRSGFACMYFVSLYLSIHSFTSLPEDVRPPLFPEVRGARGVTSHDASASLSIENVEGMLKLKPSFTKALAHPCCVDRSLCTSKSSSSDSIMRLTVACTWRCLIKAVLSSHLHPMYVCGLRTLRASIHLAFSRGLAEQDWIFYCRFHKPDSNKIRVD